MCECVVRGLKGRRDAEQCLLSVNAGTTERNERGKELHNWMWYVDLKKTNQRLLLLLLLLLLMLHKVVRFIPFFQVGIKLSFCSYLVLVLILS